MKRSILILVLNVLLISFTAHAQDLPYKAGYSSNFKMGSHDFSKMILELYKGYEANDFSKEAYFADTVMAILPNGQIIRGKTEVINAFKSDRQQQNDVKFSMDAIIPLVSADRNENWVALWGNTSTSQGKSEFQAIWRINKEKKVDFIKLFSATSPQ